MEFHDNPAVDVGYDLMYRMMYEYRVYGESAKFHLLRRMTCEIWVLLVDYDDECAKRSGPARPLSREEAMRRSLEQEISEIEEAKKFLSPVVWEKILGEDGEKIIKDIYDSHAGLSYSNGTLTTSNNEVND